MLWLRDDGVTRSVVVADADGGNPVAFSGPAGRVESAAWVGRD